MRHLAIFAGAVALSGCLAARLQRDRSTLTDAERAFAETNAKQGQRTAWLQWFAEDGVMFHPGPVNARVYMSGDPQPPPAPPGAFDWRPVFGAVAASGDLGFNTGPVRVQSIGRSDRYFFSIWRKQPDGAWRVVVDIGVQVDVKEHDPFDDPFVAVYPVHARATPAASADLEALDRRLTSVMSFLALVDRNGRGLRWQQVPLVGAEGFRRQLESTAGSLIFEPLGSGLSRAYDFGYTFGRYRTGQPATETGYYARVWRRDESGSWKILFDVARPGS